jgi:hypothetical protein
MSMLRRFLADQAGVSKFFVALVLLAVVAAAIFWVPQLAGVLDYLRKFGEGIGRGAFF